VFFVLVTICAEHHYAQTNTTNVNKTRSLLQTTGGEGAGMTTKTKNTTQYVLDTTMPQIKKTYFERIVHLVYK
jgi:hypothetical protein